MNSTKLSLTLAMAFGAVMTSAHALELYVDSKTKQIYAEPGPGRVKLGSFKQVDGKGSSNATQSWQELEQSLDQKKLELEALEKRLDKKKESMRTVERKIDKAAQAQAEAKAEKKWYDKFSIRGYGQLRYSQLLGGSNASDRVNLSTPTDRSIGQNQDLLLRRMRLVISGDVSDYLSIYLQPDFASSISGVSSSAQSSTSHFAQIRDAYADIYFDRAHEYRIRAGQSKVPFGFESLQSSQNRVSFERADAINSTSVRDERDLGIFAYWSPEIAQQRFKYLQKSGLKGSGDYGVIGLGIYNGQGANRFELNDQFHMIARASWPFELPYGQFLEVGASAYTGRYRVDAASISGVGTPTISCPRKGCIDSRYGVHAVLYPKPFGLQAEWTWGETPRLNKELTMVESDSLTGGYVMAMYRVDHFYGSWTPYAKWETYNGGSKFDNNSPFMSVNQFESGIEWQPMPELELTAAYANMDRTNLSRYTQAKGGVVRFQLQWNY